MAYKRIEGLDRAGMLLAQGITGYQERKNREEDQAAMARIFSSMLGGGGAAAAGAAAGGSGGSATASGAPNGLGAMGLSGVNPDDLARVMSSKTFDPSLLAQLLKGSGAQKTYQTMAGDQAAKFLGLDSFSGGAIQVGADGKVDVIVTPPDLKDKQRPTSIADGWYYDPATKQINRLPGYMEDKMALARAGKSSTNVNVSPTAIYKDTQGAAANPLYKASSDAAVKTMTEADDAINDLQNIQSLNRTLEGLNTGTFTEAKSAVLKGLQGLGLDIDPNQVSNVEAARNISADLILKRMKALGGNDTTEERDWVQSATPSTLMSPGGRKMVEYIQERRAARLDKQATFEGDIAQKVIDGTVSPGEARRLARENALHLVEQDKKTWNPPVQSAAAGTTPTVSTGSNAPTVSGGPKTITDEAGYNALKSGEAFLWKDKDGNVRQGVKP